MFFQQICLVKMLVHSFKIAFIGHFEKMCRKFDERTFVGFNQNFILSN